MQILELIKSDRTILGLILSGLFFLIMAAICFTWNDLYLSTNSTIDAEKAAQFGDLVGGLAGSLWALAGIFLFYKALTEQRCDFKNNENALRLQVDALNQQIEEFQENRKELVNSRKVYEEQSKNFKIQQLESNFYSLLDVYRKIKENVGFKGLTIRLEKSYSPHNDAVSSHQTMVQAYNDLFLDNRELLSHYFRIIYRIIKIIESNNQLSEKEKYFYMTILRAQLTDYEIIILYYNSQTTYGKKTRSLILKYNLLKHLPLFSTPEFKPFLNKQADNKIIAFTEEFDSFLSMHISLHYDVDSDIPKIEEKFVSFNLFFGIYFNEKIELKAICNKDITNNGIKLNDEEFGSFIYQLLFERIVFSRYINPSSVTIAKSVVISDTQKEFCISIESDLTLSLNKDEY